MPKRTVNQEPAPVDATSVEGPIPIALRISDPSVLAAADKFAKKEGRSRNNALNILLQRALAAEGLWPPSTDAGK